MLSKVCTPHSQRPQSPSVSSTKSIPAKLIRPSTLINVSDEHQCSPILAPSPKKMIYRGSGFSPESDEFMPWILPHLDEDSDEDSYDGDFLSDQFDRDDSGEAFAELFKIIHKSSVPSSPLFENSNEFPKATSALRHFSEDQGFCEYLGRSPISRTQNPLPLDTMFSQSETVISPSRTHDSITVQLAEFSTIGFPKLMERKQPLNCSFERLPPRPRSYSAGARPDQCGTIF